MDTDKKSKSDPKEGELFLAQVAEKRYKDAGTSVFLSKVNRNDKDGKEPDQLETKVRKVTLISSSQPILGQYWVHAG